MATSKFTVSRSVYKESSGDLLILVWTAAKRPVFDSKRIPAKYSKIKPGGKDQLKLVKFETEGSFKSGVCTHVLDKDQTVERAVKQMVSKALAMVKALKLKRVVVAVDAKNESICSAVQEGALLGGYIFDKYKQKRQKPVEVLLVSSVSKKIFKQGEIVAMQTNFARDTLNEPPVEINPASLAQLYKIQGKASGLKMDVWTAAKLKQKKCGGILAVGNGSAIKPRLVTGHYKPAGTSAGTVHLALVGKGITFDSGGYSLKPSKSMEEMKMDMGGAAMMFGAACVIAELKLPIEISLFCPLAHNAVSSTSYNVSDVVKTRSGQTIEVMNTDAEGRIILSDAITLACEKKPDYLIDAATLTGAAVVALGEDIAAVYGTDSKFTKKMVDASAAVGEDMWEMPLHTAYSRQYNSLIADMKNTGARWGGSIGAALFLKRFVKDVKKWIHVDIAGPGCKTAPLEHLGKGAKGFGIKSIVQLAITLSNKK